jgi:hypothetical protein
MGLKKMENNRTARAEYSGTLADGALEKWVSVSIA